MFRSMSAGAATTFTTHVATTFSPPSGYVETPLCVLTVTTARPLFKPLTAPVLALTSNTVGSSTAYVRFAIVSLPSASLTVTLRFPVWPSPSRIVFSLNDTCAGSPYTVTLHVAALPLYVLTVIVAVPGFTDVIKPFSSTVATFASLLVKLHAPLAAPLFTAHFNCAVCPPALNVNVVGAIANFVGAFFTYTAHRFVIPLWLCTYTYAAFPAFAP